jgi:hypothetical protein
MYLGKREKYISCDENIRWVRFEFVIASWEVIFGL